MKKLTLSLIAVILFTIYALGWGLDELFSQYQSNDQETINADELSPYISLGRYLAKNIDQQSNTQQFVDSWEDTQQLSLTVTSLDEFQLPMSLQQSFNQGEPLMLESDENISIHFILPKHQQVMTLVVERSLVFKGNDKIKITLTLVFYLGIIFILFIWLYPLIRDLQALKRGAKVVGNGDLTHRINMPKRSYITEVQDEFNRMANRIETLVSDNEMLGNAVAHDLRTPLARLRFGIEMLQDTVDHSKRKKYENRMNSDINEMEKLVDVLLCYARLEQNMVAIDKHELNLLSSIHQCVDAFKTPDNNNSWEIEAVSPPYLVLADEKYLNMLINNLLKNAVQYSKSKIKISLEQVDGQVHFSVEDDGVGIPRHKRQDLLKPFCRGSDSNEITGFGMGLAIVDRITQWHNSQLFIDDSLTLGGAKFTVIFSQLAKT